MKKGLLVTFEGIDGSGKTTQIRKFIEKLEQSAIPFILVREPGGTEIGEKVRDILLDISNKEMFGETELLLYSASRFQLTCQTIIPALEEGKVVVCDRFYDSTTAYQGFGRGIDPEFIRRLNGFATQSLAPDLTIVLDVSLDERMHRIHSKDMDRLETEHSSFQQKVRDGFRKIAEQESQRAVLIDGALPVEEISEIVWSQFEKKREGIQE